MAAMNQAIPQNPWGPDPDPWLFNYDPLYREAKRFLATVGIHNKNAELVLIRTITIDRWINGQPSAAIYGQPTATQTKAIRTKEQQKIQEAMQSPDRYVHVPSSAGCAESRILNQLCQDDDRTSQALRSLLIKTALTSHCNTKLHPFRFALNRLTSQPHPMMIALLDLHPAYGIDVNEFDSMGRSPFSWACTHGCSADVVRSVASRSSDASLNARGGARPTSTPFLEVHLEVLVTAIAHNTTENHCGEALEIIEVCCDEAVARNDGSGFNLFRHFKQPLEKLCAESKSDTVHVLNAKAIIRNAFERIRSYKEQFPIVLDSVLKQVPTVVLQIVCGYSLHSM
jgi:hypothetical protein